MKEELAAGGRYELVKELGQGTFGCVLLARDRDTGELVALKQMDREHAQIHYVKAEILNHSTLHHPHIVGLRSVFLTPRCVNLVLEYAPAGTLLEFVQARKRLKEPLARWFFQQLIVAVDYCHRKGVANRDIKLDNLLLAHVAGLPQPIVKVCDFGYSKSGGGPDAPGRRGRTMAHSKVGTINYVAPEVLQNGGAYDARKADVWSCGVVLFALLTGRFPFKAPPNGMPRDSMANGVMRMLQDMAACAYVVASDLELSPACHHLLSRLLDPNPKTRICVAEILKNPWFSTNLPANALAMNDRYFRLRPPRQQTDEEVRALVDALEPPAVSSSSDEDDVAPSWEYA